MGINRWRAMWVIAVYDCPMTESEQKHDYMQFRRKILQENFFQLQYSLYTRHFPTMAAAQAAVQRLVASIPEGAKVAFFLVTDKQFAMTKEYFGPEAAARSVETPAQIELF